MASAKVAWGIDVGTTSLKAIKLARSGDGVTVEAFDVVEHDKPLTAGDTERDVAIRTTLLKFLERNPIKREAVYVGVPGSSTFAKFVKLPPVEPKKIPEIVKFEAVQQIPFPLDQVNWDYQTFSSPDSPDVEVGIFAMKKELVVKELSNYQANKMAVSGVQMSPLAVQNAVAFDGMTDDKGTIVLDIGAEHTDLIVIEQGRLWMRTINIGGNNFTDALAKAFKQSFQKAEGLKKTAATNKYAKQIYQSMRPIFADLVTEIQRSIGFYNSSHRDSKLERIIGMGNPFKLPNLQKYLQQELKMEVVRLESFRKATAEGRITAGLNENILAMPAAYGLALQGLGLVSIDTNLLPTEVARQMVWSSKRPWFAAAAACIVVGVGLCYTRYFTDSSAFGARSGDDAAQRRENESKLITYNNLKKSYNDINNTFDGDSATVKSVLDLSAHQAVWPAVLRDILEALPQNGAGARRAGPDIYKLPRKERQLIVIQSFYAEYKPDLTATSTSSGTAAPAAPAPGTPPVAGAPVPPPQGRGFLVTIKGYTPYAVRPGRVMVDQFCSNLKRMTDGKAGDAKPYFFNVPTNNFTAQQIMNPGSGMAMGSAKDILWGQNANGPFATVFGPDILGLSAPPPPPGPAPQGGGMPGAQPLGATLQAKPSVPFEPGTKENMYGDTVFELHFNVYMKEPHAP